jgi:hypothetical protein
VEGGPPDSRRGRLMLLVLLHIQKHLQIAMKTTLLCKGYGNIGRLLLLVLLHIQKHLQIAMNRIRPFCVKDMGIFNGSLQIHHWKRKKNNFSVAETASKCTTFIRWPFSSSSCHWFYVIVQCVNGILIYSHLKSIFNGGVK